MEGSGPDDDQRELDRLDVLQVICGGHWSADPGTAAATARLVASANEVLERPTVGAWLRAHGHEPGMCEEARVALAWEIVQEARRWWIFDRLESILGGLTRLADPDVIARRLRSLADLIDGGQDRRGWAAA